MKITKKAVIGFLKDTVLIAIGSLLYSFGLECFAVPHKMVMGGAGGIATVLYHTLHLPIGIGTALVNIPLLILCYLVLGRKSLWRTAYSTVFFTVMMGLGEFMFAPIKEMVQVDLMIGSLFGGLVMGIGLAIVYMRDYISGGSDLAARVLAVKAPILSFGKWVLALDAAVIFSGLIVFRDLKLVLYSVLMVFVCTMVFDTMLEGRSKGKMAMIITEKPDEVATIINETLGRGCTLLEGKGSYTGATRHVLMCAVTDKQAGILRSAIVAKDQNAFVVMMRATAIWGTGFFKL